MSFAGIAVGIGAVGVGISGASAAGAFNHKVDKFQPTPQELDAAAKSKKLFQFGQDLQRPVDALAREDLGRLKSPGQYDRAAGEATSAVMDQADPMLRARLDQAAESSGGPGSGRWFARLGTAGSGLAGGLQEAKAGGRLGTLQNYLGRSGQYLDRMTGDVNTGMGLMEKAAGSAAERQGQRINAQVLDNQGRNQAIGQLGGSLVSLGMSGAGALGGGSGGAGAGAAKTGVAGAMNPAKGAPYGGYVFANPAIK